MGFYGPHRWDYTRRASRIGRRGRLRITIYVPISIASADHSRPRFGKYSCLRRSSAGQ